MLKVTKKLAFVTFLSLVAFYLGGWAPLGYAYAYCSYLATAIKIQQLDAVAYR